MAKLLKILNPDITAYKDRRFDGTQAQWERAISTAATVYVGNLSFYTREEQIYDVFSRVGHIKRVVMGLDKKQKTPCGFCFVTYYTRAEAEACVKYLNGTTLDDRPIRVDHDWGFVDGRQWGRGLSGGQVRDEFRQDYDPGRGGYGKIVQREVNSMQAQMEEGLGEEEEAAGDEAQAYGGFGFNTNSGTPAGQGDPKRRRMHSVGSGHNQGGEQAQVQEEAVNPRFKDRDSDDEHAAA